MPINSDFRDLFAALNAEGSRYLLVGGYAVAHYARPRYTKDLDVWVDRGGDNPSRVFRALVAFGAPAGFSVDDLSREGMVLMIGVPPNRIDILTSVDALDFLDCWERRLSIAYGDEPMHVVAREDLIRNKRAAGRPRDMLDVSELEGRG